MGTGIVPNTVCFKINASRQQQGKTVSLVRRWKETLIKKELLWFGLLEISQKAELVKGILPTLASK